MLPGGWAMKLKRTQTTIAIFAVATALTGCGAADVPATGTSQAAEKAVPGARVARETRYYGIGPSAEYDFDAGVIGVVSQLRIPFPSGTTFDVVVTVSMNYRTSADDRFVVGALVRRDGRFGPVVDVKPEQRVVAASTTGASSTTVFLIDDLPGGHDYFFSPVVNVPSRVGNRGSITSRNVVFVVDAMASG